LIERLGRRRGSVFVGLSGCTVFRRIIVFLEISFLPGFNLSELREIFGGCCINVINCGSSVGCFGTEEDEQNELSNDER
jgi:hypothetical protein